MREGCQSKGRGGIAVLGETTLQGGPSVWCWSVYRALTDYCSPKAPAASAPSIEILNERFQRNAGSISLAALSCVIPMRSIERIGDPKLGFPIDMSAILAAISARCTSLRNAFYAELSPVQGAVARPIRFNDRQAPQAWRWLF
jgi:hypothetical protein